MYIICIYTSYVCVCVCLHTIDTLEYGVRALDKRHYKNVIKLKQKENLLPKHRDEKGKKQQKEHLQQNIKRNQFTYGVVAHLVKYSMNIEHNGSCGKSTTKRI